MLVTEHVGGRRLEIPYEAKPGKRPQDVISSIYLPPTKPLPNATLKSMVIFVPAFTHGEECEQPVVARIVAGDIARAPTHMRKRVDAERSVINQCRTPAETDHQPRPSGSNKTEDSQSQRWPQFELVQKSQFGIAHEIRHSPNQRYRFCGQRSIRYGCKGS